MLTPIVFATAVAVVAPIALPGGPPVGMDYLAYDAAHARVWVPAGNTGNVDVVDTATGKVTAIGGFPTAPSPRPSRPKMGPSSVTLAGNTAWVGNRADHKLCALDARTLARGRCVELPTMPDGIAWVAATHELWATTPADRTLTIVPVKDDTPGAPATIKLEGAPEGYAVDEARGLFFVNYEDQDKTLAVDVKSRKVKWTWSPGCGKEGPRGLAFDAARKLLLVACTDGAVALDTAHDGKVLGRVTTGGGVDNIDFLAAKRLLYIASRADGKLTLVKVGDDGVLTKAAELPTAAGARNAVCDAAGTAYVADTAGGRLIVVPAPK